MSLSLGLGLGLARKRRAITSPLVLSPIIGIPDSGWKQTVGGIAASADADPVGEWPNVGSGGVNLTQATAGDRGTLKTAANGINSLSVVRFDGVSDFLAGDGANATPFSGDDVAHTLYCVFRLVNVAGTYGFFGFGNSADADSLHYIRSDAATSYTVLRRDDAGSLNSRTGGTPNTNAHVLSLVFTGTVVTVRLDGIQLVSNTLNVGLTTLDRFTLGGLRRNAALEVPAPIDIGEFWAYSGVHGPGTYLGMEAYLRAKWGTP